MGSSLAVTFAVLIIEFQQGSPDPATIQDKSILIPLVLIGIGYSIYACALWGSVPYVVPENLLGSAFGLCTAVQNTGLTLTPLVLALTQSMSKTNTVYNHVSLSFLALLGFSGFCVNIALYFDDINNRGGVLNNVAAKREELQQHMESPPPKKAISVGGDQEGMFVGETAFTEDAQDPNKLSTMSAPGALKRSIARASLAK